MPTTFAMLGKSASRVRLADRLMQMSEKGPGGVLRKLLEKKEWEKFMKNEYW